MSHKSASRTTCHRSKYGSLRVTEEPSSELLSSEPGQILRLPTAIRMHVGHITPLLTRETVRNRRYHLESFATFLGPMALKTVKARHIQDWLANQAVAASTLHLMCGTVRYFFKDAVKSGWLKVDPSTDIQLPRRPKKQPRTLTMGELKALGQALPDERARLVMALAINEGLRRVEICNLEMGDLDLFTMTLRVVTAKSMSEDAVPLTADTYNKYLLPYMTVRGTQAGPLIRSYTTGHRLKPTSLTCMVNRWFRDAGIKESAYDGRSLHAGRHSCASHMLDAGAPPTIVQKALRHASLQSTWTYLRNRENVESLRPWMGLQPEDAA